MTDDEVFDRLIEFAQDTATYALVSGDKELWDLVIALRDDLPTQDTLGEIKDLRPSR